MNNSYEKSIVDSHLIFTIFIAVIAFYFIEIQRFNAESNRQFPCNVSCEIDAQLSAEKHPDNNNLFTNDFFFKSTIIKAAHNSFNWSLQRSNYGTADFNSEFHSMVNSKSQTPNFLPKKLSVVLLI